MVLEIIWGVLQLCFCCYRLSLLFFKNVLQSRINVWRACVVVIFHPILKMFCKNRINVWRACGNRSPWHLCLCCYYFLPIFKMFSKNWIIVCCYFFRLFFECFAKQNKCLEGVWGQVALTFMLLLLLFLFFFKMFSNNRINVCSCFLAYF